MSSGLGCSWPREKCWTIANWGKAFGVMALSHNSFKSLDSQFEKIFSLVHSCWTCTETQSSWFYQFPLLLMNCLCLIILITIFAVCKLGTRKRRRTWCEERGAKGRRFTDQGAGDWQVRGVAEIEEGKGKMTREVRKIVCGVGWGEEWRENGSLINCSFYKVTETCQQCQ